MRSSDSAKNRLTRSGGAVDFKAKVNQLIDHLLDLIFTGRILHGNNHEYARFARRRDAAETSAARPNMFCQF